MTKFPIELDEITLRYLKNIEFQYDSFYDSFGKPKKSEIFVLDRFIKSDRIDHEVNTRFEKFKEFFEKNKSLHFLDYEKYLIDKKYDNDDRTKELFSSVKLSRPYKNIEYEKRFCVEILNIKFIKKFLDDYTISFTPEESRLLENDNGRMLYMNKLARFFYGLDREEASSRMVTTSSYFKMLICLYLETNGHGNTTISRLTKKMKSKFKYKKLLNPKDVRDRLDNIRKFMTLSLPTGGDMIFCKNNGKIIFENPKIMTPQ